MKATEIMERAKDDGNTWLRQTSSVISLRETDPKIGTEFQVADYPLFVRWVVLNIIRLIEWAVGVEKRLEEIESKRS